LSSNAKQLSIAV